MISFKFERAPESTPPKDMVLVPRDLVGTLEAALQGLRSAMVGVDLAAPEPAEEAPPPALGSRWQHYKGGFYRVVAVGKCEADLTPVVVYAAERDGSVWVRPLHEWRDLIAGWKVDGPLEVSRFTPIGENRVEIADRDRIFNIQNPATGEWR